MATGRRITLEMRHRPKGKMIETNHLIVMHYIIIISSKIQKMPILCTVVLIFHNPQRNFASSLSWHLLLPVTPEKLLQRCITIFTSLEKLLRYRYYQENLAQILIHSRTMRDHTPHPGVSTVQGKKLPHFQVKSDHIHKRGLNAFSDEWFVNP